MVRYFLGDGVVIFDSLGWKSRVHAFSTVYLFCIGVFSVPKFDGDEDLYFMVFYLLEGTLILGGGNFFCTS